MAAARPRPAPEDEIPVSEAERIEACASHFRYLDEAHESGVANMFGVAPYLQHDYGLSEKEAKEVLANWMKTFDGDSDAWARARKALGARDEGGAQTQTREDRKPPSRSTS